MPADAAAQDVSPAQRRLCVLYADVAGSKRLTERIGEAEAARAFERCFNRMERAVSSFNGRIVKHIGERLMAVFEGAEGVEGTEGAEEALRAACEMQSRVEKLPAVSGIKLALGIGLHHGPMVEGGNDSSGDTVKVAARLARLAKGGQVLTSASTVAALPASLSQAALALGAATVSLHGEDIPVFAVLWQNIASGTPSSDMGEPTAPPSSPPSLSAPSMTVPRLRLRHDGREIVLGPERPMLTMGRDAQCDLVIRSPHASRQHGRIELRHRLYVLSDRSTNGTHVTPAAEAGLHLQDAEFVLRGRGCLSFGPLAEAEAGDIVTYELL
ncbi:adenylate/guanylate cyclase domain-containing protein [Sterolibacterium denitrificans]|nr:adenylate/guanylate cyclase domain-containing protein [Sterolibacterium denitrificans]